MRYFLMTLWIAAYGLASFAYFAWIWDSINHLSIAGICGCMAFVIAAYLVITALMSIAFENVFDVDLGW